MCYFAIRRIILKHKGIKKVLSACVFTLAVAAGISANMHFCGLNFSSRVTAAVNDSQKQIHQLENNLSSLQKETNALKKEISNANANAASLEKEIADLDAQTTLLTSQIKTIEALIEQLEELSSKQALQIAELEEKEQKEQKIFDNMLRMSYEYGSDTYFNLIFGSEDIGDFLSRADLITYHLKYNNNVLENLSATKKSLEDTRAEQQQSLDSSSAYKNDLEALQKELEEKIKLAREKKAKYESEAKNAKAIYDQKTAEFNEISAEIRRLYEEQRKNNTAGSNTAYSGTFQFPLPAGTWRKTSDFTSRISPISGKRENHNGLDLAAPHGTKIYAADAGTVKIAKRSPSWGNYVTIDHGGGIMTLYAHASALNVTVGQTVKKGDVIAYVGSTGWSTGNHLHFTVYKNGVAVNPAPYIGL